MRRLLTLFFGLGAIGLAASGAGVLWLESPSAAGAVSRWLSDRLAKEVPSTQLTLERLDHRWPFTFWIPSVQWGRPGEDPLIQLDSARLTLVPFGEGLAGIRWRLKAQVKRLDLSSADRVFAKGQWKAQGFLSGPVELSGRGSALDGMHLTWEVQSPGGSLGSKAVESVLNLMPSSGARAQLQEAMSTQSAFRFHVGRFQVTTQDSLFILQLLLDGDHLLDLTVRVSKEDLGTLGNLLKGG